MPNNASSDAIAQKITKNIEGDADAEETVDGTVLKYNFGFGGQGSFLETTFYLNRNLPTLQSDRTDK